MNRQLSETWLIGSRAGYYKAFIPAVLALLLSACATGPVKIDPYTFDVVELDEAELMPTRRELSRDKPRVAILPLDLRGQSGIEGAELANLEAALRGELETSLLDDGKVDLLDRVLAKRLKGALEEYERAKGDTPAPFQQADYLLIGQIDTLSIDSEFKPPVTNRKGRLLPGVCIVDAEITGTLKVYDLLENGVAGIEEIKGRERRSNEANGCGAPGAETSRQLYQQASKDAADGAGDFLRQFFAPAGYIAEKRSDGKSWTFKVTTLGSAMADYKSVAVYERRKSKNRLTGKREAETLSLGTARITDQRGDDFVWIHTDERELADRVRLGHLVRPVPDGFDPFDMVRKLAQ